MMMTPAPLHSFLNTLFLSTPAESSFEEDLAKFEENTDENDDCFDTFSCATTIVCQLRDKQISIVQDNALIHGGKPKTPLRRTGSLDMSSSETRWSHDTSSNDDNNHNKSSMSRKPRCPRRRASMDCSSIIISDTTTNSSIPRRPRRRGTMEFDTEAAGPSSPTKKDTPTTTSPSSSPKMPMRRGTVEFSEPPRSRRLSIEETKDENTMRPRFPKRRSSIVVGGGCDNEEGEDDEIDVHHQVQELEFNDDNNKPSAACDNTRDRMIHCPQRRASIVEMPSAAANALAMKEAQAQLLRTYSAQDVMHNLKNSSSELDEIFQLGEDL